MTQQDHTMQRDCRHFLLLLNSPKPCDKFAIISKRTFRWLRLRTSFARLREVNLLSCLSDGLDRSVHCLETEASAQYLTAPGTQPPPYGSQQVLSPFLPTANVARNDSDSCAVGRATAQKAVENNNPMSHHMQPKCNAAERSVLECRIYDADSWCESS